MHVLPSHLSRHRRSDPARPVPGRRHGRRLPRPAAARRQPADAARRRPPRDAELRLRPPARKNAYGKLDAKITFVNGARVSGLKAVGTHGNDIRYAATVSSSKPLKLHQKYTVTFRLGDAQAVERFVKVFNPGEHG